MSGGVGITQVELNIGINNNPHKDFNDIYTLIKECTEINIREKNEDMRFVMGVYNGEHEPTCVIGANSVNRTNKEILQDVERLCVIFDQECISVKLNGFHGHLVYNPKFKGEIQEFNDDFFLDFYYKTHFQKNFK